MKRLSVVFLGGLRTISLETSVDGMILLVCDEAGWEYPVARGKCGEKEVRGSLALTRHVAS